MKRSLLLALAVLAAVLAVAPGASLARVETTSPTLNYTIDVYVTGKGVTLTRSVAKRGWIVHFRIHNKTSKPLRFEVGGLKTKVISPGKSSKLGTYLDARGQYEYKVDNVKRGYFQVI